MIGKGLAYLRREAKRWVTNRNTIRYRVERDAILRLLSRNPVEGSLLDAGAGCGEMSARLLESGTVSSITGAEPDAVNYAQLKRTYSSLPGAVAIRAPIDHMPFEDGRFDGILCTQVLEHISDHAAAARELVRVTRLGGTLIVSVPFVPSDCRPEECIHYDPIGHVRAGYTAETLSALFGPYGCELLECAYFLTGKTCGNLLAVERLGWLGLMVPLALVDAECHLTEESRRIGHPGGMVCLFRKTGGSASEKIIFKVK